jgi:hypothetical protein
MTTGAAIQPVPTPWNGDLYKSREEARWAVFFAAVNAVAMYEPLVPVEVGYRPDFLVMPEPPPHRGWFFEVKHENYRGERDHLHRRFVALTGRPLLVARGRPLGPADQNGGRYTMLGFQPDGAVVEKVFQLEPGTGLTVVDPRSFYPSVALQWAYHAARTARFD